MARVRSLARKGASAIAGIFIPLLLAMLAVEVTVRWLERRGKLGAARAAQYEEAYQASAFQPNLGDAGYLAPGFSGYVRNEYGRPVEWVHNSLGFRTRHETTRQRPPGVLRILMLGDSFVAGHRIGQEETVGYRLEEWLRRRGHPTAEVLIAAIEEPAIGLDYLESFGLKFEPQVVLLGITLGNDLAQVYAAFEGEHCRYVLTDAPAGRSRRHLESNPGWNQALQLARMKSLPIPESYLALPATPAPEVADTPTPREPWLGLHYMKLLEAALIDRRSRNGAQPILSYWGEYREPRLIDGNGIGMHLDPAPPEIERTYELLSRLLAAYRRVCDQHGIRLVVMIHGDRYQVQPRDLEATIRTYRLRRSSFDAMQPNRRIRDLCRGLAIPCLDPTEAMTARHARSGKQLFMPRGDMHWNADGAEAFFDGMKVELERELPR